MLGPLALAALVASLVPPLWVALSGGADVDAAGFRFDFYGSVGPGLALLGTGILSALPAAAGRTGRVLRALAFLALGVAAAACWTPGIETEWIRIRSPERPAQIGLLLAALAFIGAHGRPAFGWSAGAGLLLGLGATAALLAADRAELARGMAGAPPGPGAPGPGAPDVIFVLADTLRADALGVYGASPSPSPFLDALAERSVTFERALSQAPWTSPSVSSLLSSLYPSSFLRPQAIISGDRYATLPAGLPWLPELLRQAGYHTAGFVKNPFLQRGTRFEHGFQVYEWLRGDTAERHSAAQLVDAVLRWAEVAADRRADGRLDRFFLYVHFMDPHVEYRPPEPFWPEDEGYDGPVDGGVHSVAEVQSQPGGPRPEDVARLRALYRGEVAYLDGQLARLHEGLASRGLWSDETVVVLVADHGEQFFEHGSFLHGEVDWENVHVPFLLRAPGLAPRRVPELVALLDLTPTLLDLLGLEVPEAMEGGSLLPRLAGETAPRRVVASEIAKARRDDLRFTGPEGALILRGSQEWFQEERGPTVPAAQAEAAALAELREAARRFRERPRVFSGEASQAFEPDADTRRRLEAIGYVE